MKKIVLPLLLTLLGFGAKAEDAATEYTYFGFDPEIVTNYVSSRKKLGYVRVSVELMVRTSSDMEIIEHHEPLLRSAIVEILGNQTEAQIKSLSGRDTIRKHCLDTVNQLLKQEVGKDVAVNLLFTKFLYD
ncbi:MAG: flagellar basal body-associated protein FliL [Parashewanella sp.]